MGQGALRRGGTGLASVAARRPVLFPALDLPSRRAGAPSEALSRNGCVRLTADSFRSAARLGASAIFRQPFQRVLGANFDLMRLQERRRTPAILACPTPTGQSLLRIRAAFDGAGTFPAVASFYAPSAVP